jgi:Lar family restriction alleviation protein
LRDKIDLILALENIVNDKWMWKNADYYAKMCKDALSYLKSQDGGKISVETRIKPCPFCGNTSPTLQKIPAFDGEFAWVRCDQCGAEINHPSPDPFDAVHRWNTRACNN